MSGYNLMSLKFTSMLTSNVSREVWEFKQLHYIICLVKCTNIEKSKIWKLGMDEVHVLLDHSIPQLVKMFEVSVSVTKLL